MQNLGVRRVAKLCCRPPLQSVAEVRTNLATLNFTAAPTLLKCWLYFLDAPPYDVIDVVHVECHCNALGVVVVDGRR